MSVAPRLLKVPPFHHELTIKATQSGIVVLKDGRYKKRYTGSKYSTVDINGNFYEKSSDLKAQQLRELSEDPGKHKKRAKRLHPPRPEQKSVPNIEDNEISLYTKQKKPSEYRVNKMEVRGRLLSMINTMKGSKELYFWTVTFPACMTDDDLCYQAFNTWLTALRQKNMLKNYLWVAERQDGKRLEDPTKATGTIHFHIAIPHKMHVVTANRMMRTTLATFAKNKLINYTVFQAKKYNGVHITKNKNTGRTVNFAIKKGSRALANYLTKYVTKNDGTFTHLAWHNSRGFSALFTGITFTIAEFIGYGFKECILHCSIIHNEFFNFYPWTNGPPEAIQKHLFEVNSFLQTRVDKVT